MSNIVKNCLNISVKYSNFTQIRHYPRWTHRRPIRVYSPEEYNELEKKHAKKIEITRNNGVEEIAEESLADKYEAKKINWSESRNAPLKVQTQTFKVKPLIATNQKAKTTTDMLETIIDDKGNLVFEKMKNNDPRIGLILTEIKSKKDKSKKDSILLEGKRLIKDALIANCQLKYILFSRKEDVEELVPYLPKIGAHLYKMPYREMQLWSDLTTTPGIMGVFKSPDVSNFQPQTPTLPFTVICDNVREPGNLGAILRICAGVGCEKVILTKGCVNLWEAKVTRSSMGAHFKLQIHKDTVLSQILEQYDTNNNNVKIFIADNRTVTELDNILPLIPYYSVDYKNYDNILLIIGGETLGISNESYELVQKCNGARLVIPLNNDLDSLNVGTALGIIAFEIKRQLSQNNQ